ncbi:tRNA (adenosine(37)-N6)-threonylcarbamoyltransferase complex dimerization subunit type 1 TsaB [Oscillospiraceae bacterium MB08-C2-2]|nr:tRNA (adenosine(37)-N6)-threonylcarbamoyltransferase complex dimerization subunit type 1 TsaB [Oscillospiraceae bacterium MB08-C2-2]
MILALDSSAKAASCALWEDGVLRGETFLNTGLTHSQTLMSAVEALLEQTRISLSAVDRLAVSAGPGSFTGLRIGIAAVKGLAMGLEKPCVGVSTLKGLAFNLEGFEGIVVPVMDARRQQVYTALFESGGGGMIRLCEDAALSIEELSQRLAAYADQSIWLVGDGAALCYGELSGENLRLAPEHLRHQRAASVARAAVEEPSVPAGELLPVYLRLPQAQREYLEKLKGESV